MIIDFKRAMTVKELETVLAKYTGDTVVFVNTNKISLYAIEGIQNLYPQVKRTDGTVRDMLILRTKDSDL